MFLSPFSTLGFPMDSSSDTVCILQLIKLWSTVTVLTLLGGGGKVWGRGPFYNFLIKSQYCSVSQCCDLHRHLLGGVVFSSLLPTPFSGCSIPKQFLWSPDPCWLCFHPYAMFRCNKKAEGGLSGEKCPSSSCTNCFCLESRPLLWRRLASPPIARAIKESSSILTMRTWWGSWRSSS